MRSACAFWILALTGLSARAQAAAPSGFFTSQLAPERNSVEYQVRETPASRRQDPAILDNRLRGLFVLAESSATTWSLQQSLGSFHLSNSPVIPGTGLAVPRDLREVETGVNFRRRLGDRHDWGLSAGVGSASDQLFDSIHETSLRATAAYRIPSREMNSWLFLLAYSNNRQFANNVPLPGVAYMVRSPEHGLEAILGLPFLAVSYKPTPDWSGRLAIFGPNNLSVEWACLRWKPAQAYAGFDWSQREWLRAHRPDNSQRLFFDEKKWTLGTRFPLAGKVRLDLAGAYEFNRRFYESDRARSSGVPAAEFKPAWSFQAKAGIDW
ncbi:MAG: hypothetical protein NTY77_16365 [Elusimicrobia bacterium]|nr:hypothetical protein [Elusimicrobiota bacterium]